MWAESLQKYEYPLGAGWKQLFEENAYEDPRTLTPSVICSSREDEAQR